MPQMPVRLAVAADPGADLYNGYHLLAQLTGLYAQAALHDPHVHERSLWTQLAEQGIEDLGDVVSIWNHLAHQPSLASAGLDADLHVAVTRACRRTEVVVRNLNLWVPFQRWARLLGCIERKWSRLLERLEPLVGPEQQRLAQLRERATLRSQRILGLCEKYTAEYQRLDAKFAASAQLLANGGLSA